MHPNRRRRRRTSAPKRKRGRAIAATAAAIPAAAASTASLMSLKVLPELLGGGGNVMQSAIDGVLQTDGDWEFPEFPPSEEAETYAGGMRRLIGRMFQT